MLRKDYRGCAVLDTICTRDMSKIRAVSLLHFCEQIQFEMKLMGQLGLDQAILTVGHSVH